MPPRIYIFLWLLSNNKTLTRDNLAKRRNVEDSGPLSISYLQPPRAPTALHLQPRRGLLLTAGLYPHLAPLCHRQPPPCAELPLWPAVRTRSAQGLGCILLPPEVKMGRQGRGAVWSYVLWLRAPQWKPKRASSAAPRKELLCAHSFGRAPAGASFGAL